MLPTNRTPFNLEVKITIPRKHNLQPEEHYRLGQDYETAGLHDQMIPYYRLAAEHGHAGALGRLGFAYLYGHGVEKNIHTAIHFLEQGAEKGNADAQFWLAGVYSGTEMKNDLKALHYLKLSASQGHSAALCGFTFRLLKDKNNDEEVFHYLILNAAIDNPTALLLLEQMYTQGCGVEKDAAIAEKYHTQCAGRCAAIEEFVQGKIEENKTYRNINHFKQGADQGDSEMQFRIGFAHLIGLVVEKDIDEGVRYLTLAAKSNDANALYALEIMHFKGWGVPQNDHKVDEYCEKLGEREPSEKENIRNTLQELFASESPKN